MPSLSVVLLPLLGGTIAIAAIGLFRRWGLRGRSSPMQFLAAGFTLTALILGVIYITRWGFTAPPQLLPGFWGAILVGAAANFFIQYFDGKAATYKKGEVSFTKPLQALTPGLIVLLALTLGEVPGVLGWSGVALMAVGSWVILMPKRPEHWWDYLGPLYRLRLILHFRALSPDDRERAIVVWLAFGSAALGTVGLLCDGLYSRRGGDMQGLMLALITLTGLLAVAYSINYAVSLRSGVRRAELRALLEWRYLMALAGFGVMWAAHAWLISPVFTETFVAYVGTLKRLSIIMSVILGYLLFREEDFKKRLGSAALIVAGAVLIGSEDLPASVSHKLELFGF